MEQAWGVIKQLGANKAVSGLEIPRRHDYYVTMNKPLLSPVNDYVFKRVFGENLTARTIIVFGCTTHRMP